MVFLSKSCLIPHIFTSGQLFSVPSTEAKLQAFHTHYKINQFAPANIMKIFPSVYSGWEIWNPVEVTYYGSSVFDVFSPICPLTNALLDTHVIQVIHVAQILALVLLFAQDKPHVLLDIQDVSPSFFVKCFIWSQMFLLLDMVSYSKEYFKCKDPSG